MGAFDEARMERADVRREALHVKGVWARMDKEWIDQAEYAILAEEYFTKNWREGAP